MKSLLGIVVVAVLTSPLAAQATVIMPEKPLEASRENARQALYGLRDSVNAVTAAATRLRLDLRRSSGATLLSRASDLSRRCEAAERSVPSARARVDSARPSTELERKEYGRMLVWLDSLPGLFRECSSTFRSMVSKRDGEYVRGYANRKAEPLLESVKGYETMVRNFFRAYRMQYRPLGAPEDPLAG